ncbi:cytochrome c oxidase subunit II [Luteolibacter sp. GHJ8]|jgi:cytochrome c oxidase subunit 2|uniref:cytochrome-c oxidase n=1 Tax=Luteolibacter rhizosphaerae TaxID=2989719 RepID=A0ABT3G470_9BACT|nr:cytochrome c oxidase subunit II [Luteolibacter rhizosphaerae]MCW1914633.1 cytochrome c oxidase subunit II [Luteolibacter rhizosphaerae]
MSPSKFLSIPENFSAHGGRVDHLIDVVHWFMIALGVGWFLFFAFCLIRFRASVHPRASYHGVRNHISSHLEIAVVIIEAVLLLGFAFPLWKERTDTWQQVQKLDPVRVRVIGWQFGWTYHYPGADGKFGRIDPLRITSNSDPGIDLDDPNAQDDFIAPMLKIAKGRPAILNITSNDVIHNYAIVPMRIQQDAIPGKEIPMWFTPNKTLETSVVCAQLCGEGHGNMIGQLEVVEDKAFRTWAETESANALKSRAPKPESTASR